MRRLGLLVFMMVLIGGVGCGGGKLPEESKGKEEAALPEGHPPLDGSAPMGGGALGAAGPTDGNALPLKLEGLSSAAEMDRGKAMTQNADARTAFESGFRKTFTSDPQKRDYQGAVQDLDRSISLDPNFAAAYRARGYAKFNLGFNVQDAMTDYLKAVELKPDYGEAHYALAFMYAMPGQGDRARGEEHFKRAMELGVPDERDLKTKFYSNP
jgi:tetratricopeptide (TPR) repeat protein